jgi:PAS domain S-box-containing protein
MDATALRAVFEAVATPQVVLDPAGIVLMASQAYLRSTSSTREAVIGRALAELPPYARCEPAQRELATALEISLRSGVRHALMLEGAAPTASGTRFTSATLTPIAGPSGAITHVLHAFEPEGRAAAPTGGERRLRKMIEDSYETIGLVDERGMFTFVCGIDRVLGFSEQEWLALPALETIHPDDVSGFGAEINRMFSTAGARFLTRVRSRHKDGSWRVLETAAVNRLDDPDIASVVITFRDVTEQIAMQEEARRSEERLRIALSAARALCWEIDFGTNVHTFSEDFAAYHGLPASSLQGNDALQAVHPDDRARVVDAAVHARDAGGDFSVEFRGLLRADGTRWYASHGRSFRDDQGKPVRMLGVTWDISERRRMEEERRLLEERLRQSQKLESLGVLAGGIAHDFNNLLMAVLGNASLLEDRYPQDADARHCLSQTSQFANTCAVQLWHGCCCAKAIPSDVEPRGAMTNATQRTDHALSRLPEHHARLRWLACARWTARRAEHACCVGHA